jgi:hypothetical protein
MNGRLSKRNVPSPYPKGDLHRMRGMAIALEIGQPTNPFIDQEVREWRQKL